MAVKRYLYPGDGEIAPLADIPAVPEIILPPPENSEPVRLIAPEIAPPPPEFSKPVAAEKTPRKKRRALKKLFVAAAAVLMGMVFLGGKQIIPDISKPQEPPATERLPTQPVATETEPTETEPAVLTDAQRLVAIGTWKNSAENEWVHFNEDGTGWWYDGTFFGCMDWAEDQDGGVRYDAAMAYLGPGRKYSYDWAPETEGDSMHCTDSSGSIALLPNEDRLSCPGLRFGTGSYLPDDMPIDASVMDGVCGKTPSELLSGTSWHMVETSNLGIPIAPSSPDKPGVYTDLVYVQSIDFGSGSFRLSTRDGGLLEQWIDGTTETGAVSPTLDVPFALSAGGKLSASALCEINANCHYVFYSDYSPGNTEYNNMQLLWGHQYGPEPEEIYLFFTGEGPRLGMRFSDWYPDNYTLLALD